METIDDLIRRPGRVAGIEQIGITNAEGIIHANGVTIGRAVCVAGPVIGGCKPLFFHGQSGLLGRFL